MDEGCLDFFSVRSSPAPALICLDVQGLSSLIRGPEHKQNEPPAMLNPAPIDPLPRRSAEICRGTLRLMSQLGYYGLTEMTLANHRRADIAAIGPGGDIWMIEIKSSTQDFKSDTKWREYMDFCDRLTFAVGDDFPQELIPPEAGLIVADSFYGAIIREAPETRLAPARRKAVTLRFARLGAARLTGAADAGWTPGDDGLTSPIT